MPRSPPSSRSARSSSTTPITLILGADETVVEDIRDLGRTFVERTLAHWREWVRGLAIPFEWQAAVIRAAITLKLNAVDDTGAIVAAMTTSIPEAPDSGRNWDYRFCWLRDGYFVVNALNRLGATSTMEGYLGYLAGHRRQRERRTDPAGVPHQRQRAVARAQRTRAAGLPRHGPGARRQRRLAAGAARRVRLRDPRRHAALLRRAPDAPRRRRAVRAAGAARPARGGRARPARRGPVGTARQRARAHVLERHVLGGVRPPGAHRHAAGTRRARGDVARRGGPHPRVHRRALLERGHEAASSPRPTAARSTRACCCSRTSTSSAPTIPASSAPSRRSSAT